MRGARKNHFSKFAKSEARNPKSETNQNDQMANAQHFKKSGNAGGNPVSNIRILDLFRISDFGFRICRPQNCQELLLRNP
jgi:hypothetical protein